MWPQHLQSTWRLIPWIHWNLWIPPAQVPLRQGQPLAADSAALLAAVRKESEADRAVMEAGTKAFVSYVRAYKEHHCKFIFRVQVGG